VTGFATAELTADASCAVGLFSTEEGTPADAEMAEEGVSFWVWATTAPTPRISAATNTALTGSDFDTLRSAGFSSASVISNHSGLLF
jgi:hypothetical protein